MVPNVNLATIQETSLSLQDSTTMLHNIYFVLLKSYDGWLDAI